MSNLIFVLDSNQKPLTPCKPSMAHKLLTANKAAIFRMYPFTIVLKKVVIAIPEPITLKIDPGSKTTGMALVQDEKVIWGAELTHRGQAIKASLESRRSLRRGRRNRHTRYRQARFLNRTRLKDWLAPSLQHHIGQFLAKKPEVLKRILSQAKRTLKDAAAVNSTRWALFNKLRETGLTISTGSGGLTKFNRTRLNFPKTHWLDAACVGQIGSLEVLTSKPLLIKAAGHGTRQMCRTDKLGFPSRYVPRIKFVKGFQTGDIVKAIVTTGKKIGTYIGRVTVRTSGSFNISASKLVSGISYKYCQIVHRKDGYSYTF